MNVRARLAPLFLCLTMPAAAQLSFHFDESAQRWTIANSRLEASFELTPDGHFTLDRLTDRLRNEFWEPPAGQHSCPIRLRTANASYDEDTQYRLISHRTHSIARRGYRQSIVLEDLAGTGRFQLDLDLYEFQPVLRSTVRFRNLSQNSVQVTAADMLPLLVADAGKSYQSLRVKQWVAGGHYGNFEPLVDKLGAEKEVTVYSGADGLHCSWLATVDTSGRGLFAGWEFNGRALATLEHLPDDGQLRLTVDLLELDHPVAPQQEFRVPTAFLGLFHGGWDEAGFRTQRFVEAVLARALPGENFPYVAWDSWGYQTNIDDVTLRRNARIAASLGIELFILDLGWARAIGDWHPDPKKFPNGLRPLSDYVHSLGMKFGLHYAFAEAAPDSPALLANPDWAASENDNYFESVSLCPAHQPVRQWLTDETVRLIEEYGVDWILQDGENMVKRCTKTTHTHASGDSNYANSVEGIDALIAGVLRRKPAVYWENCEDGGNMMTYAMVQRYVTSIAADNANALTTRQAIYGATFPFPPRYTDRYLESEALDSYQTRSHMFGGPWIFMNRLVDMRSPELQYAASEISLYKSLRQRIRDGMVYHLTGRPAENRIDALESYHAASDSAVLFVFRPSAAPVSRTLKPRGLKRENRYDVRFQDQKQRWTTTGAQLMDGGIRVDLPAPNSAEIVHIEPAASPEE